MSRRPLILAASVMITASLGGLLWHAESAPLQASTKATTASLAASPAKASRGAPEARATRAVYRIVADHTALLDGKTAASVNVSGTWTTVARRDDRTEVQFTASRLDAVGDTAPSPEDVAAPIVMEKRDGVLAGIGFPEAMPGRARDLLASLATLVQLTERAEDAWTVEEEDLASRYEAHYTRSGDTITRRRGRTTATRGEKGLVEAQGQVAASDETSTFVVDAAGIVSASVKVEQTARAAKGMPALTIVMTAKLVRVDVGDVALTRGADLKVEEIRTHVDHAAIAKQRNASIAGGAKARDLIAATRALESRNPARNDVRRRLTAVVQLEPNAAAEIADAVRARPDDQDAVSLLVGALSSAPSEAATHELASLLASPLPDEARSAVITSLALAKAPTAESAAALTGALDGPLGGQAALALGAEAKGLDGEVGDEAIRELLSRYAAATSMAEKRGYLLALANTGSREVLDVMRAALQSGDFDLGRAATYGLRLIPGDDVDDMLRAILEGGSTFVLEAIQAIAYRDPALWRPRLLQAKARYEGQKQVRDAIQAVLTRWANLLIAGALD